MMQPVWEIKKKKPLRMVVAFQSFRKIRQNIASFMGELAMLEVGKPFLGSVGQYYREFPQVENEEVIRLLNKPYEKS